MQFVWRSSCCPVVLVAKGVSSSVLMDMFESLGSVSVTVSSEVCHLITIFLTPDTDHLIKDLSPWSKN